MSEIWKPVVGYEGLYEVSNMGNVRSLTRMVKSPRGKRTIHGQIMVQQMHAKGYLRVGLQKEGRAKIHLVHSLVLEAFKGERNNRQCNHIDGNADNNHIGNLEWSSVRGNINHKFRNRLLPTGVSADKKTYKAAITIDREKVHIGSYGTPEEAGKAYSNVVRFMGLDENYVR